MLLRRGMPGESGSDVTTMLEGEGVQVGYVVAWKDGKFSAHATMDGGLRYAQGGEAGKYAWVGTDVRAAFGDG